MKTSVIFFTLCICSVLSYASPDQTWQITIEAGDIDRVNSTVYLILDEINPPSENQVFILHEIIGKSQKKKVQCQLEQGTISRLWWIMEGETPAGKNRKYELSLGDPENVKKEVECKVDEQKIHVYWHDKSVLQYSKTEVYPPDGIPEVYKRSAFIHPVKSPNGNILTQIQPPDHYHHYGIWGPWTRVKINDRRMDLWNLGGGEGTVRYAATNSIASGPVFGGFSVVQEHIDFLARGEDKIIMHEKMDVKIWDIPQLKEGWLCEVAITLSSAKDTVILEDYRYGGGIGFRATKEWNNDNSHVLTSEGKTRKDGDATRARWCNIHGDFNNGSHSGILFLTHPGNRNYPEPMRIWPESETSGFFFEFCPIRGKEWKILPGNTYTMKYRFYCYDETIEPEIADHFWNDFAMPPKVTVTPKGK